MEKEALKTMIADAKDGNGEAKLNLIEKYKPLVNKYSYQYNLKDIEKEDLKQEGNIAILKAINRFDNSNENYSFDAYVINSIRNRYYDLARKNIKHNDVMSLNLQVEDGGEVIDLIQSNEVLEDKIINSITNKELAVALKGLSKEKLTLINAVYLAEKPNLSKFCKENNLVYSRARRLISEALDQIADELGEEA